VVCTPHVSESTTRKGHPWKRDRPFLCCVSSNSNAERVQIKPGVHNYYIFLPLLSNKSRRWLPTRVLTTTATYNSPSTTAKIQRWLCRMRRRRRRSEGSWVMAPALAMDPPSGMTPPAHYHKRIRQRTCLPSQSPLSHRRRPSLARMT
jgi:hypothetical protein